MSMSETALWLLVLLPAVVGGGLALSRLERAAAAVSLATAFTTAALSVVVALERPRVSVPFMAGSDLALGVDALSALVAPTVAVVSLLVLVFSAGEIRESQARFHGLMLLFASAALLTATAETLPALLFAWEVMGATSFALVGFWWRDDHRVSAGITAFVTTRTADVGLYIAAGAALAGGAGLSLGDLPASSAGWRHVVAAGVLVAALGKAAQLPFSFWLSRAMHGPSPVSALLHSAAMVAMGAYLLLRVAPLLAATGWADTVAVVVGAATAVLLGVVALAQRDLKQLLAASTSAQLGFVVMAAGLAAVSGGTAQLIAHAFTKAGLFLAAGAWLTLVGSKQLSDLAGAGRRWPLLGTTATVAALALAGVAPLSLWATKDAVLAAALARSPWLYGAGLLAAVLSAAYAAKIVRVIWQAGRRSGDTAPDDASARLTLRERAVLLVLAVGAAVAGVLALPPLRAAFGRVVGAGEAPHSSVTELIVSAALALVVVAVVLRFGVPEPRWAAGWLGLERIADAVVVRPTTVVAAALARFDDRVLDRGTDAVGTAVMRMAGWSARVDGLVLDGSVAAASTGTEGLSRRADRFELRGIDGAVETLAAWIARLGALARRPQSGQLYHYYALAVVLVMCGALLLLVVT